MALPLPLLLDTLASLLLTAVVVLSWWPKTALVQFPELDPLDRLVANVTRMVLFLIVVGYLLTALDAFSWIALAAALVLLRLVARPHPEQMEVIGANTRWSARLLSELNDLALTPVRLWHSLRRLRLRREAKPGRRSWHAAAAALVTLAVVAVAAWMRFWQNWTHAALPYSDAYVLLAWMKDIQLGHLFPNGIYPWGYLLVMAGLDRLGLADPVTFDKLFGPAVGVAMVLTLGYTAYRLSGRAAPGIVAMLCYGTLTFLFPYTVDRQAASLAQEFGSVFALPTAYFAYRSWIDPEHAGWRWMVVSLLAVAGLVHPIPLLNAALAAVAGTLGGWMAAGVDRRALLWYLKWVPLTALLVALPIVLPRALGIPLYGSSAAFLVAGSASLAPPVSRIAAVAAGGCLLLFLFQLLRRRDGSLVAVPLVALMLLGSSLLVQQLPRLGIHSALLSQRSGNLVAFSEALGLAMVWWLVEELLCWLVGEHKGAWLSLTAVLILSLAAWHTFPPQPLGPYSMTSDAYVLAYEKIVTSQTPDSWLAVSNNFGYAFALGQGFQMDVPVFVSHVSPTITGSALRYAPGGGRPPYLLGQAETFLFVNQHFHLAPLGATGRLYLAIDRRDTASLKSWLRAWRLHHLAPSVFFSSPELTVYELKSD